MGGLKRLLGEHLVLQCKHCQEEFEDYTLMKSHLKKVHEIKAKSASAVVSQSGTTSIVTSCSSITTMKTIQGIKINNKQRIQVVKKGKFQGTNSQGNKRENERMCQTSSPSIESSESPTVETDEYSCICKKPSYGKMIACDNPRCQFEWFHFDCVLIKTPPAGEWYCPTCILGNNASTKPENSKANFKLSSVKLPEETSPKHCKPSSKSESYKVVEPLPKQRQEVVPKSKLRRRIESLGKHGSKPQEGFESEDKTTHRKRSPGKRKRRPNVNPDYEYSSNYDLSMPKLEKAQDTPLQHWSNSPVSQFAPKLPLAVSPATKYHLRKNEIINSELGSSSNEKKTKRKKLRYKSIPKKLTSLNVKNCTLSSPVLQKVNTKPFKNVGNIGGRDSDSEESGGSVNEVPYNVAAELLRKKYNNTVNGIPENKPDVENKIVNKNKVTPVKSTPISQQFIFPPSLIVTMSSINSNSNIKSASSLKSYNSTSSKSLETGANTSAKPREITFLATNESEDNFEEDDNGEEIPVPPILTIKQPSDSKLKGFKLCPECPRYIKYPKKGSKTAYKEHLEIHKGLRPFVCPYCLKGCVDAIQLLSHSSKRHTGMVPFLCETCKKSFVTYAGLLVHQRKANQCKVPTL